MRDGDLMRRGVMFCAPGVMTVATFIFVAVPSISRAQSAPPPKTVTASQPTVVERWVDLQTAMFQVRYRDVESSAGVRTANQAQDSITLRARLTFDAKRRFSLGTLIGTGSGFISSWNNTGIGTGDTLKTLYMKQLYVQVAPMKGVDASYGGIGVVRGENTEITSYDNDGFLLGERVSVKRPKNLYFDEVSFTNAYLGSTSQSSFFKRTQHLDERNYRQALFAKKLRPWISASGDYTWLTNPTQTVGTVRAAVTVKTEPARVVDLVRWEQYRRGGTQSAFGFAAYGEKNLTKRINAGGGYTDIDASYGGLNADRFQRGRRLWQTGTVKLTKELSAMLYVTEAVHNSVAISNHRRVDVVLAYNALASLQRAGLFSR
jgi:hypothetical protein